MENKQTTAMQQLIDEIIEHLTYDDDLSDDSRTTYETIRLRCLGKLEIEKQQIIEAANILLYHGPGPGNTAAEQYYKDKYEK
jgi:hypothetical protein